MSKAVAAVFGGGEKKQDTSAMDAQLAEQKAENARIKAQNEEERRLESERLSARRSSRLRGGSRLLLSEARLAPETGLQETLGSNET